MKPGRPFTKWCEVFPSLSSRRSTLPATLCACQQLRCSRTSHQRQNSLLVRPWKGSSRKNKLPPKLWMEPHLRSNTEPREPTQGNAFCSCYRDAYPPRKRNSTVSLRYFHRGSLHGKEERAAGFGKLQPPAFLASRAQAAPARAHSRAPQLAHVTLIDSPARRSPSHRPSAAVCQSQRLTAPHWLTCAPRSSSGTAALRAHRTR